RPFSVCRGGAAEAVRRRKFHERPQSGRSRHHAAVPQRPYDGEAAVMTEETRHDEVKLDFESNLITIPLDKILPLKPLRASVKESRKYAQICASIAAIGVVEPPAVLRDQKSKGGYLLLDGHLRIEALRDIGATETECLIATVDDTYTYN